MFFQDKATHVGVESPGYGRGTAMVDLDNDGLLDLIVTTAGGDDQFWRQTSSQNFQQMNIPWSVPATLDESWGVLAADFDNDGDKDVYFSNGGFTGAEVNVMLRNDLNTSGKFTDISASSGTCASVLSNFGGSVLDYDNDGDLDIFLTAAVGYWATTPQRCELYRNDGDMQFTNVGWSAGITHLGDFRNCGVADYDNDGYMDIMVGSYDGNNLLYHNNGDGTFTDKAQAAGVQDPFQSFGATFEDFNNDGWPDLFIPKYEFNSGVKSRVYINNQDETFRDITDFANMSSQGDMGHNTGDVNADGYPDILIGTGHPYWTRKDLVKVMFPVTNSDSMSSHEAAEFMGLDSVGASRSHGYALGDIDNDGDVDIYNNNGGPSQIASSWGYNAFYFAEGNTSNWMKMSLKGVVSNRDAIGARVMVEGTDGREIWRYPAAGKGFCNTDSPVLHFGLGEAAGTELTEIYWPSTLVQTYVNLDAQKQHDIVETGIRISGTPVAGGQMIIRVSGVPGGLATSFYSLTSAFVPDPVEHVVHRLGGNPIQGPSATINQSQAGVNIPFTIPASATSGTTFFIQVTVTDPRHPNGIRLKTNAVEFTIL
ncbi:MAG: CRTAC1 family protein [Planctomycetes bacterium]|nr:CRTAC1 family protein [Planctomycetota bacterium]